MKSKLFKAILPLAFVFSLISCSSDSTDDLTVPAQNAALVQNYEYTPAELELADVINEYRASIGLNALQTINHISYKSEEHNVYMIKNNVVNHDLFDQRSQNIIQVLGATKVNENVAFNYVSADTALQAWLASPGHRANIEGEFTHFGISIRENSVTGKKYYTNIFIKI